MKWKQKPSRNKVFTLNFKLYDEILEIGDSVFQLSRFALVVALIGFGDVVDDQALRNDPVFVASAADDLAPDVPADFRGRISGHVTDKREMVGPFFDGLNARSFGKRYRLCFVGCNKKYLLFLFFENNEEIVWF